MAVASRGAALSALRELINHDPVPAYALLHRPYLPPGMAPSTDPVRMDQDTLIGGYGNELRYVLAGQQPELARVIAGAPSEVLSGQPNIGNDVVEAFVKSSLDLTMEGGTTSGVVYPLAVCELATRFRFRNVGGASAGAIAAAVAAAAELGRSQQVLNGTPQPPPGAPPGPAATSWPSSPTSPTSTPPSIRTGFTGLADMISWLTQTRPGDPEKEEYRLAQLFRPGRATARIFRVVVALMRGHAWSLPLVALAAFGWLTRAIAVVLILGSVVLTGVMEDRIGHHGHGWAALIGLGALGSAAFGVTVAGLAILVPTIMAALKRQPKPATGPVEELSRYTSAYAIPRSESLRQLLIGCGLIVAVVVLAVFLPALYAAAVLVGLAVSLVVIGVLLGSVLGYLGDFRSRMYGFVCGTTPHRPRGLLDAIAGAPKPTVDKSLVPWLNDCLNALAGMGSDQVLRFGHLWSGLAYESQRRQPTAELLRGWQAMAASTEHRLVNLELMATDLTRQRPFRFPLPEWQPDDPEQLWVCVDQLRDGESQMFPEPVLRALEETEARQVVDKSGTSRTLHRLPQPWDLPVIFAVRISMSLPALFQAVRMYRIELPRPIQDDFGRSLFTPDGPLMGFGSSTTAQELWFSDGGITSNFPVHFFDNQLPRWPTVSLNLGTHPVDQPQQDVWLPQDWDNLSIPVEALEDSGLSFAGAIFDTALSWRDSLQSALPGYRNRIAQVRTSPGEGGTNLFMRREIIASMALRGALAGARLRTRFADDTQWDRFRWLRLRTAMNNIERLRASTQQRRGYYADAFSGPDWLARLEANFHDKPTTLPISWYEPGSTFWPKAPRLLNTFADAYRPDEDPADVMITNTPQPQPVLRQVPQE